MPWSSSTVAVMCSPRQLSSSREACWGVCTHLLALLTLAIACVVVGEALLVIEIPCSSTNTTFVLTSNTTYTLTRCMMPPSVNPFLYLPTGGVDVVENVAIAVEGGNVLPHVLSVFPTRVVRNISVVVRGARVGPYVYQPNSVSPSYLALFCTVGVSDIWNVSVQVVSSLIDLTVAPLGNGSVYGTLLYLTINCSAHSLTTIEVRNATISLTCIARLVYFRSIGFVGAVMGESGTTSHLAVMLSSSALSIVSNASLVNSDTIVMSVGVLSLACGVVGSCDAAEMMLLSLRGTILSIVSFALGVVRHVSVSSSINRISSDVVVLESFRLINNVTVYFDPHTNTTARAVCFQLCDNGGLSSWVVSIDSKAKVGSVVKGLLFNATGSLFQIESTFLAGLSSIASADVADDVHVWLTSSRVALSSKGQNIGGDTRAVSLVGLIAKLLRRTWITIDSVVVVATMESGGCSAAVASAASISGDVLDFTADLSNVFFEGNIRNGSVSLIPIVPPLTVGALSMLAAFVTGGAVNGTGAARHVCISIVNSTLWSDHSTYLTDVLTAPWAVVISVVAAVALSLSVTNASIHVSTVHVLRRDTTYAGPPSWYPSTFFGFHGNVTAIVSFADLYAGMPAVFSNLFGGRSLITGDNVTVNITLGSTVDYETGLVPLSIDAVSFVVLPAVLINSSVSVDHSAMFPSRRHDVAFGGYITCGGGVSIRNCTVVVRDVLAGSGALVLLSGQNTTLEGNTSLLFDNVTIVRVASTVRRLIGRDNPLIDTDGAALVCRSGSGTPCMRVAHSQFSGFDKLLDASQLLPDGLLPPRVLLALGCNLWNGAALLPYSIGYDAALLPHIAYPRSDFNGTIHCGGLDTSSPTRAASLVLPLHASSRPQISAATAGLSSALMYTALVAPTAGGRSAVPGVQRAMAALGLAVRCVADDGNDDAGSGTEAPPMFSQLVDNPLSLAIPVGDDALQYAAGAAVGNMLVVCGIALALHLSYLWGRTAAARRLRDRGSGTVAAFLLWLVPSSPMLSAPAGALSRVLQPAVGASIALVCFPNRTPGSVACGAAMLAVYAVYPVYCIMMISWRGRRRGSFVLASVAKHAPMRKKDEPTEVVVGRVLRYATTETHEWAPHPSCTRRGTSDSRHAIFLLRQMAAVFGAFVGRREWYFALDWATAAVSGAVLGAAEAAAVSGDPCTAAQWGTGCAIAICAIQLLCCAVLRPYGVRLELWMAVLLGCLELLSNVLSLVGLIDAAGVVITVSSTLELVVVTLVSLLASTLTYCKEMHVHHADSLCPHSSAEEWDMLAFKKRRNVSNGAGGRRVAPTSVAQPAQPTTLRHASHHDRLEALIHLICTR